MLQARRGVYVTPAHRTLLCSTAVTAIEPVLDVVAAQVKAVFRPIAAQVQPVFNAVALNIETLLVVVTARTDHPVIAGIAIRVSSPAAITVEYVFTVFSPVYRASLPTHSTGQRTVG